MYGTHVRRGYTAIPLREHFCEQVSSDAILFHAVQVALILPATSTPGNAFMLEPCQHLYLCLHMR